MTVLNYRPPIRDHLPVQPIRGHWLLWATFLATSWTWCIGMFLPVLLVRDFGIGGWIVFALPNVLGAGAMGWIVFDAQSSREYVASHLPMMLAFSLVTAAFQIFFGVTLLGGMIGPVLAALGVPLVCLSYFAARQGNARSLVLAVLVWVVSGATFVWGVVVREFPYLRQGTELVWHRDLVWLAMSCAFGFLLCPYLDLTFHRARQSMQRRQAKLAFAVGFGLLFAAMILYTLAYSGWCLQLLHGASLLPRVVVVLVGTHMLLQAAQTTGLHLREFSARPMVAIAILIGMVALSPFALVSGFVVPPRSWRPAYDVFEFVYRSFMGFYGLLFPAYVWLCMIPGRGRVAPDRRQWIVWAVSVTIAAPMFWMGFIQRRMIWLLPGIALVLLARLLVPGREPDPTPRPVGA